MQRWASCFYQVHLCKATVCQPPADSSYIPVYMRVALIFSSNSLHDSLLCKQMTLLHKMSHYSLTSVFFPSQSKLGHLTLGICTAHGYIYGWNKFLRPTTYKWYTPPGYMLCLIVPSVVLVLKVLLLLPCVDRTLTRIRQGWERTQPREEKFMNKSTNLWTVTYQLLSVADYCGFQ